MNTANTPAAVPTVGANAAATAAPVEEEGMFAKFKRFIGLSGGARRSRKGRRASRKGRRASRKGRAASRKGRKGRAASRTRRGRARY
jgi:hypothetical protein